MKSLERIVSTICWTIFGIIVISLMVVVGGIILTGALIWLAGYAAILYFQDWNRKRKDRKRFLNMLKQKSNR